MLRPSTISLLFSAALLLTSCSEETMLISELSDVRLRSAAGEAAAYAGGSTPWFLRGAVPEAIASKRHHGDAPGFSGPLFGLAVAPGGDVLVADAGAGVTSADGVLRMAFPGASDVAPLGLGAVWATRGGGAPGVDSGQGLYRLSNGTMRRLVDLYAFEAAINPHPANVDSNPYDVAALGGEVAIVADAAGNDLLRIDDEGQVELLAVFPDEIVSTDNIMRLVGCPNASPLCSLPPAMPAEAVPTSVAVGPDGHYYVGELKGFPAPLGASSVWRVAPGASMASCGASPDCVKVFEGGFTSIIDLAFGPDGRLYVVELDEDSWFALQAIGAGVGGTINACDVGSATCEVIATGIPMPTAIAFDRQGKLWSTRNALVPPIAEVVEIQ
jgi:hypothetical protein